MDILRAAIDDERRLVAAQPIKIRRYPTCCPSLTLSPPLSRLTKADPITRIRHGKGALQDMGHPSLGSKLLDRHWHSPRFLGFDLYVC
jgi:hypothetical protein